MNALKLTTMALAFGMLGCASIHSKHKGQHMNGDQISGLIVSAEIINGTNADSQATKDPFNMITVNVENQSVDWLRIDQIEIPMAPEVAAKVSVVLGQDLVDWASAMEQRALMEKHNREMTQLGLASLAAVATVGGAANENKTVAIAGLTALGAVQAWVVADAITYAKMKASNPKAIPENHLYGKFSVPPKMFQRRWLLLNKPIGVRITELPMKIKFVDGKETTISVKLKGIN